MRYPNTAPIDPTGALAERIKSLEAQVAELQRGAPLSPWLRVGTAGQPAFANSWVNFDPTGVVAGGPWERAAFRRVGDDVQIRGLVASGTTGVAVFVLPSGFRPPQRLMFAAVNSSGAARLDVDSSGNVFALTAGNTFYTLNCRFSVTAAA